MYENNASVNELIFNCLERAREGKDLHSGEDRSENKSETMDMQNFFRREEPVCALDPLLSIPRIEYVEAILECIRAKGTKYTLVILDMKNFHWINDVYDYDTGDRVLAAFILLLRSGLPTGSISLRFRHGDEFLFFLPLSSGEASGLFAGFNTYSEQYPFLGKPDGSNFIVSFRFAVVEITHDNAEARKILPIAELELRAVKGQGSTRNT